MSEFIISDYEKELITKSLKAGLKEAVYMLAIWKNGKQVVGVQEKPIEKIYEDIDNDDFWYLSENEMIEIKYDLDTTGKKE